MNWRAAIAAIPQLFGNRRRGISGVGGGGKARKRPFLSRFQREAEKQEIVITRHGSTRRVSTRRHSSRGLLLIGGIWPARPLNRFTVRSQMNLRLNDERDQPLAFA